MPKPKSKKTSRNVIKQASTEIVHTKASKLRAQYSMDRSSKEDNDWILPESRQMLDSQREKLRENGILQVSML